MNETQAMVLLGVFGGFYLLIIVGMIPTVIGDIMVGLGIKHDATALGNTKGTMFCLLTIFLGAIPAVVYSCIRTTAARKGEANEALLEASEKKLKSGFTLVLIGNIIILAGIALLGAAMLLGGEQFIEVLK